MTYNCRLQSSERNDKIFLFSLERKWLPKLKLAIIFWLTHNFKLQITEKKWLNNFLFTKKKGCDNSQLKLGEQCKVWERWTTMQNKLEVTS